MCLTISILILNPRNLFNATLTEVFFFSFQIVSKYQMTWSEVLDGKVAFQGPVGSTEHGHQGLIWGDSLHISSGPSPRAATLGYKDITGASLVVQWIRIRLPMQRTWVWALVQEDPTCHGATKPVRHNYWACIRACKLPWLRPCARTTEARTPRAHAPQHQKPPQSEACALQRRVAPTRRN